MDRLTTDFIEDCNIIVPLNFKLANPAQRLLPQVGSVGFAGYGKHASVSSVALTWQMRKEISPALNEYWVNKQTPMIVVENINRFIDRLGNGTFLQKKLLSKCGGCKMIDADPAFASLFGNPERACEYAHYEPFLKAKADWVVLKRSNPGYAKTNADIRHELYVLFTFLKHGYKGQNSRVPIPTCVEAKIKNAYPPKNGHYTFFNLEREMKKSKAIAAEKRAFKQKLADIKTAAQQKKAMLKATAEQMAMEARDAMPSKEDGEHQKSPSFDLKAAAKEAFHDMKDAYDYNGGSDDSSCDFFDDY